MKALGSENKSEKICLQIILPDIYVQFHSHLYNLILKNIVLNMIYDRYESDEEPQRYKSSPEAGTHHSSVKRLFVRYKGRVVCP